MMMLALPESNGLSATLNDKRRVIDHSERSRKGVGHWWMSMSEREGRSHVEQCTVMHTLIIDGMSRGHRWWYASSIYDSHIYYALNVLKWSLRLLTRARWRVEIICWICTKKIKSMKISTCRRRQKCETHHHNHPKTQQILNFLRWPKKERK